MPAEIHDYDPDVDGDLDVKFEHLEATGRDSALFRVWTREDQRREWRVEVSENDFEIEESRRDGALADLATPDWLENWAAEIQRHR
jgi:hypothetical protein